MAIGDILRTVATGLGKADGVAWDGSTLWLYDDGDYTVHQFDPIGGADFRSYLIADLLYGDISFAYGALVTATILSGGVSFIDPHTGTLLRKVAVSGAYPRGVTWDGANFWYHNYYSGTIYQVNPHSGAVLRFFARPGNGCNALAWHHNTLLVADDVDDLIYQVNPHDGSVLGSFASPCVQVGGIEVIENTLWVCGFGDNNLYQLALN